MSTMTEKEKMLAGEIYNGLDPELEAERQKARKLFRLFNRTGSLRRRQAILHRLLGHIGSDSIVEPPFYCCYGAPIFIGDFVYINYSCTILDCNQVQIGNHVMIGPGVQIYTASHHMQAESRIHGLEVARPVTIGDNVWIGGGAILLPGIRIGRNAVVGAGAVVRRNVPADVVVAGDPAVILRKIGQSTA